MRTSPELCPSAAWRCGRLRLRTRADVGGARRGTFAWVGHHTTFEPGGPARVAATPVAKEGRRDPELAEHVDGWLADLEQQAAAGEFSFSINDYAVLLRKP